ncbi:MAG: DUF192 domain-containing protein [Chlamydiia bacterium]|nr:DUF192 domain-containing protein [Chlamydiia bacterium]
MKVFETELAGKKFRLAIAIKVDDKKKGLAKTKKLKKDAGMLFVFDKEETVSMNMRDMNYSLDMLFLDKKFEVIAYHRMHKNDEMLHTDTKYVIEVNAGELSALPVGRNLDPGEDIKKYIAEENTDKNVIIKLGKDMSEYSIFKRGGKISPKEVDLKAIPEAMQVLNDTGIILMNITGGERIFSRKHTEKILKLAKDVSTGKEEPEKLGELMTEILHIQDTQKPEYVYE